MAKTLAKKSFGRIVKRIRKEQGITQEQLGELVGVHRTYIGAVERGEKSVSVDNIARIAKALGVRSSDLFKDK